MLQQIITDHLQVIQSIEKNLTREIKQMADLCRRTIAESGKILFMGNGGSAADAQHLAAELVGRFVKERLALPAIALTTDTSILTAVGNDYGYDRVFERQVAALTNPGDVVVGISTSGNSPNVVKALETAKCMGAITIGMTGQDGGKLAALCDLCIKVPSSHTARIQEAHILIGHIVCAAIDEEY